MEIISLSHPFLKISTGTIVEIIHYESHTLTQIMHELSIAQSIIEIVEQAVAPSDYPAVNAVRVRVGEISGVVPDSLDFCFSAAVAGSSLSNARLQIEYVPLRMECKSCSNIFASELGNIQCPRCEKTETAVVSGTELQVVEIELADHVEAVS